MWFVKALIDPRVFLKDVVMSESGRRGEMVKLWVVLMKEAQSAPQLTGLVKR